MGKPRLKIRTRLLHRRSIFLHITGHQSFLTGRRTIALSFYFFSLPVQTQTTSKKAKMSGSTMAILGCGNMGTAILDGILSAMKQRPRELPPKTPIRPSRFIACVNRAESVARLEHRYREYLHTYDNNEDGAPFPVCQVWQNSNAQAVKLGGRYPPRLSAESSCGYPGR